MVAVLGAWRVCRDVEAAMDATEMAWSLQTVSPIGLERSWNEPMGVARRH